MKSMLKMIATASATLSLGALCFANQAEAQHGNAHLIINEWNAVGANQIYGNDTGPEPNDCDDKWTPVVGSGVCQRGNGGNWLELVVQHDHLNIEGWTITWENEDVAVTDDDPLTCDLHSTGTVTFADPTNHGLWNDLRKGTIIVINGEDLFHFPSDVSSNPCSGDWLIEVNAHDPTYITQTGEDFKTDNDGWTAKITNGGTLVQDFVGEDGTGAWWETGSGVNNQELGKLEANPGVDAVPATNAYNDGDCSSYGAPNCWNNGGNTQSFTTLRSGVCP